MQDLYPSRRAAEAEMRPRLDPVVHSDWSNDAPITARQAAAFDRDGYMLLENIFSDEEVAFLQRAAGSLLADPEALDSDTIVTEPQSDEIRSIFEIHRQSPVMARLASDARLADVARFLLGDKVYIHQSRLNYKPGFKGREFYWHSDFETWHVEDGMPRMRALSMSVLLAENTPHNGPLMVIPGSHRTYLTCVGETPDDHYLSSLKKQEYGVPDEDSLAELALRHGIVAPTGKPGTVLMFHGNLAHASPANITPYPRKIVYLTLCAVSNHITRFTRPEWIAHRDFTPITPCEDDALLKLARRVRQAA
jgi:ectoine hydroxylase